MSAPEVTNKTPRKTIPFWLALVLYAAVWGAIPWTLSLLTPRYGWTAGRPGLWNWFGLIPLAVGLVGSLWGLALHSAHAAGRLEWASEMSYFITRGPYAISRNPMYLFELILISGWAVFYGSIPILVAFVAWWAFFVFLQVPSEERTLEAHFGEAYRQYKTRVPRWLGKLKG